jgi:hypothetical protein
VFPGINTASADMSAGYNNRKQEDKYPDQQQLSFAGYANRRMETRIRMTESAVIIFHISPYGARHEGGVSVQPAGRIQDHYT